MEHSETVTSSGWTLTAYCKCVKFCGKSDGKTASGYLLKESDTGKVCAAPSTISFDTSISVSGGWSGTVVCQDRGGAIKDKRLDIYHHSHQDALVFGKK